MKNIIYTMITAALLLACSTQQTYAQTDDSKIEVGVQVGTLTLRETDEKTYSIGGRFTYNVNDYVALDTELNYLPQDPSGNYGETEGLFGVKAGKRFEKVGVFAKARPGFVHFGGNFTAYNPNVKTKPALDLGGVLEYYPTRHTAVRFDLGDTLIFYGGDTIINHAGVRPPTRPGASNNTQASIGFSYRFK